MDWRVEKRGSHLELYAKSPNDKSPTPKTLPPQESTVLEYLLRRAGERCTSAELIDAVWMGKDPANPLLSLGGILHKLRYHFDDHENRLLITHPGKPTCYQFLGDVRDLLEKPVEAPELDFLKLTCLEDLRRLATVNTDQKWHLLNPRRCPVRFVGRSVEQEDLWRWLKSEQPISFLAVTGQGGRGKTRLAIRLLELLEERENRQWHAGILESEHISQILTFNNFQHWRNARPTLIVIDYVSLCAAELENVVRALRHPVERAFPLRFLLIDRGVSGGGQFFRWYQNLINAAGDAQSMFVFPLTLPRLNDTDALDPSERYQLLDAALEALHNLDGQQRLEVDADAKQNLSTSHMGDPLVVMMAAIIAHDLRNLSPLTYGRIDLADILAGREEYRTTSLARPQSDFLPLHMAACVTLTRGMAEGDLSVACRAEKHALEEDAKWGALPLQAFVAEKLLPSDSRNLAAEPVTPDVVGEIFVERILGASYHQPVGTIFRMFERHPDSVTGTMVNLVHDLAFGLSREGSEEVTKRHRRVLEWIAQVLQMLREKAVTLDQRSDCDGAERLIEKTIDFAELIAFDYPQEFVAPLASSCCVWGDLLINRGTPTGAIDRYAYGLRQLKPVALCNHDLWSQASSLALAYHDACVSAGEAINFALAAPFLLPYRKSPPSHKKVAVSIIETLLLQMPVVKLPECESHFRELARRFGDPFQWAANEAQKRYGAWSRGESYAIRFEKGIFLRNLAKAWNEAGYPQESVAAIEEAISDLRWLAQKDDVSFLPALADAFLLRHTAYDRLGNADKAAESVQQAVELYRNCVARDGSGREDLAYALHCLLLHVDLKKRKKIEEELERLPEVRFRLQAWHHLGPSQPVRKPRPLRSKW